MSGSGDYAEASEIESRFAPPDLRPGLPLLEAYFRSDQARHPAPIRNYHLEAPVADEVRRKATSAAVLIPIIEYRDGLSVLFTRRHQQISYPGHICFPGGRANVEDADARATALREAEEEIDLDPDAVRILGTLGEYHTQSGFCITPVVGILSPPLSLTPRPGEVEEILEMPLSVLTRAHSYRIWRRDPTRDEAFYALEFGDMQITGPTVCLAMGFYEALALRGSVSETSG